MLLSGYPTPRDPHTRTHTHAHTHTRACQAAVKEQLLETTITELEVMDTSTSNGVQLVQTSLAMASPTQAEQMEQMFVTGLTQLSRSPQSKALESTGVATPHQQSRHQQQRRAGHAAAAAAAGFLYVDDDDEADTAIRPISLDTLCGGVEFHVAEVGDAFIDDVTAMMGTFGSSVFTVFVTLR